MAIRQVDVGEGGQLWIDDETGQQVDAPDQSQSGSAAAVEQQISEYYSTPDMVAQTTAQIPAFEQAFTSKDPAYADYWSLYGAFPVGGTEADKLAWMQKAQTGGGMARVEQDRVASDATTEMIETGLMIAATAFVGGFATGLIGPGAGAAAGAAEGAVAGVAAAETIPELGLIANAATADAAVAAGIPAATLSGGPGALTLDTLGQGGAFDMDGSKGVFDAQGNPLYKSPPVTRPTRPTPTSLGDKLLTEAAKTVGNEVVKGLIGDEIGGGAVVDAIGGGAGTPTPFSDFSAMPWRTAAAPALTRISTGASPFGANLKAPSGMIGRRMGG